MPNEANTNEPAQTPHEPGTQASSDGATPTSSTDGAPASASAAAQDTGFKFAADEGIPDWLVGKTPKEAAAISQQLYQELLRQQAAPPQTAATPQPAQPAVAPQQGFQQSQYGLPQQPYNAPQSPQVAPGAPQTDLDWNADPQAAATAQAQQLYQQQVAPQFQQMQQVAAQQSRSLVALQRPDEFKRWGPEIDLALQQLQPQAWTTDNIVMVVDMVRSRHIDEIVDEQAEARLKRRIEMGELAQPAAASGGAGQIGANVLTLEAKSEKLPEHLRQRLQDLRINESTFNEFIEQLRAPNETNAQARERWFAAAEKGDVIIVEDPQARKTEIAASNG